MVNRHYDSPNRIERLDGGHGEDRLMEAGAGIWAVRVRR